MKYRIQVIKESCEIPDDIAMALFPNVPFIFTFKHIFSTDESR